MKKVMKNLASSISAAFAISSLASSEDAQTEDYKDSSFDDLTFDSQVNTGKIPIYLAAHGSHRSHSSHGSHRSSSGGSGRPAPSPSYTPAPAPNYSPPVTRKKDSDPLGQQSKPKDTYKPAVPDAPSLANDPKARAEIIKRVQLQLMLEGDYEGPMDGIMGPKTRDAIDIYKIKRGLKRGGYLDKDTLNAFGIIVK
ncbi:His-Xaa-Ser repeat protein HxsA [Oceanicoccus sagamiensis]|uniref:His-Xaa-Ser repeat protein HxsA n=1 Tax=Oceanicoccus sagamiensis TaxID=716816 RepID=A0A1X9N6G5_9GAMM|nr:His-Xaa-Ser repeat protein HxsA [Oceanicoccus sagamiensis]ARN73306.1 His-Xaa-Ser repeat protein HxsA [Oceanicoccus sagamiensis]